MIKICTICVRGGSKGVKGKNGRMIAGKPLLAHTVEQARQSGVFDFVAVSSDDARLLEIAQEYGADHVIERPAEFATDTAGKIPAIQHALLAAEKRLGQQADIFVDLDATSPLRNVDDIRHSIALLQQKNCSSIITGSPAHRSPYFNMVSLREDGSVGLVNGTEGDVVRRQDAPACFDMNASIYVWNRQAFMEKPAVFYPDTHLYEMPPERSVDIDSELDFKIVELLMREQRKAND